MVSRYSLDQVLNIVTNDDDEFIDSTYEEESDDDEFSATGDFLDETGNEAVIPNELLVPSSTNMLSQMGNSDPSHRDSLLLCDEESDDGKYSTYTVYSFMLSIFYEVDNEQENSCDLEEEASGKY